MPSSPPPSTDHKYIGVNFLHSSITSSSRLAVKYIERARTALTAIAPVIADKNNIYKEFTNNIFLSNYCDLFSLAMSSISMFENVS